jgi:hypothetical protein
MAKALNLEELDEAMVTIDTYGRGRVRKNGVHDMKHGQRIYTIQVIAGPRYKVYFGHAAWKNRVFSFKEAKPARIYATQEAADAAAHRWVEEGDSPSTRKNGQEVAQTILKQMGGTGKLAAMVGAKDFIAYPNGVAFKFMDPGAGKPNYVKIVLNASDTYDLEFGRLRGMNYKVIKTADDVYVESLRSLFERTTGLYLSL